MKSILKEESISIDLEKDFSIKNFINITDLNKRLNNESSLIVNNTRINKINGLFYVKSFKNIESITKSFIELNLEINCLLIYIENLMLDKEMIIKKNSDVILFSYIDLLFNYYLLKFSKDKDENNIYLKNISKIIGKKVNIKTNKKKVSGNSWIQSTLLETAIGNLEWVRDGRHPYISHNINKYLNEINAKLVEIPKNYEKNKLEESLLYILKTLNKFEIKNRDFILRFRKIRKIKKDGLFIKSNNTIILDPRDISAFQHELGHFVYENNINFKNEKIIISDLFYNIVKENYIKYKENLKIHKIEDYKENSEIFALYFEKLK